MRRFIGASIVILPALLATWFFARGVGELVASLYFPPRTASVEPLPVVAANAEPPKRVVPALERPAEPVAIGPCAIASRVVALVADDEHPSASLAVLSWPGATGFKMPMVRTGSALGRHRVAAITASRVWLDDGSRRCFLDGTTEQAPKAAVVTAAPGIERVDDTHVRIDRTVRDDLVEKGAAALGNVRIVPEVVAGKVVGMKVLGVPATGPLAKLGLRVGDSIVSVNGFDITTPEGALDAYARLRSAPSLEVSLRRDGKPLSLRVDVI